MREPTEVGTIVLLSTGEALLLVEPTGTLGWWSLTRKMWQEWAEFSNLVPSIVRQGYTPPPPPTPEPTNEWATIRTVDGLHWQRRADGSWCSVGLGPVRKAWGLIPGISEGWVLVFAGVPDA
jgi:hypothetical protein